MSADPAQAEDGYEDQDARDWRLLRRVVDARARGDEIGRLREQTTTGELLAPYWPEVCRIVSWRLASLSPDRADVEDIASKVIEEMIKRLKEDTNFDGVPFRVVVFLRAQTRAVDYWRARVRSRTRHVDFGGELPEIATREETVFVHAEVMAEIIEDLGPRDQRILVERYVVGLSPQEIADGLGVSRKVVDTAYSRALATLRANPRVIAVRNRMEETV
ncbi:MAG: sigma-70 family RNA polymerase sigma factor [Solirubrobacteraceae bacterium]